MCYSLNHESFPILHLCCSQFTADPHCLFYRMTQSTQVSLTSNLQKYIFVPIRFASYSNTSGPLSYTRLHFNTIPAGNGASFHFPIAKFFREPTHKEFEAFDSILFKNYEDIYINAENPTLTESAVFGHTIKHFLSLMASDIYVSKTDAGKYEPNIFDEYKVSSMHLGMGNYHTWYGTPDARIRGSVSEVDLLTSSESEEDQLGNSVCLEAKKCSVFGNNYSQLISTAVVSSFVEHNNHDHLNSAVPTLLINQHVAYICVYDCVSDILLISDEIIFKAEGKIVKEAAYLLWLTLNHRQFLCKVDLTSEVCKKYSSEFHTLAESKHLTEYQQLKLKNINWLTRQLKPPQFSISDSGPFVDGALELLPPDKPTKRMRYEN